MYYSDEVGALVFDFGSAYTKVGHAGEGAPKVYLPTPIGSCVSELPEADMKAAVAASAKADAEEMQQRVAQNAYELRSRDKSRRVLVGEGAQYFRENMEISYPVENGLVSDWEGVEKIFEGAMTRLLHVDPEEHPFMIADPAFNPPEKREKMVQLAFETFRTPAVFLARSPVLAAFSLGKSTTLVLDSGAGVTCVAPVHDGYVLNKGLRKTVMGGHLMDEIINTMVFERNKATKRVRLVPRFRVSRQVLGKNQFKFTELQLACVAPSYERYMVMEEVRNMKEALFRVWEETFDLNLHADMPKVSYELPDGKMLSIGTDRFAAPEMLFVPGDLALDRDLDSHKGFRFQGISNMVRTSIEACDVDLQREMYSSIIVTGGNTLFPGLTERLTRDLGVDAPPAIKPKVLQAPSTIEKKCGVWIGGSILASLGTFHQMWMSKKEYEESGVRLLSKKFP